MQNNANANKPDYWSRKPYKEYVNFFGLTVYTLVFLASFSIISAESPEDVRISTWPHRIFFFTISRESASQVHTGGRIMHEKKKKKKVGHYAHRRARERERESQEVGGEENEEACE